LLHRKEILFIIFHQPLPIEAFEKCSFLPAQLNPHLIFNRGSSSRKAKILTTGAPQEMPLG
jgi:hypothetical protein